MNYITSPMPPVTLWILGRCFTCWNSRRQHAGLVPSPDEWRVDCPAGSVVSPSPVSPLPLSCPFLHWGPGLGLSPPSALYGWLEYQSAAVSKPPRNQGLHPKSAREYKGTFSMFCFDAVLRCRFLGLMFNCLIGGLSSAKMRVFFLCEFHFVIEGCVRVVPDLFNFHMNSMPAYVNMWGKALTEKRGWPVEGITRQSWNAVVVKGLFSSLKALLAFENCQYCLMKEKAFDILRGVD